MIEEQGLSQQSMEQERNLYSQLSHISRGEESKW